MHRNYFLFYRQVQLLHERLSGKIIHNCFSYRKNELVLDVGEFYLHIGIAPHIPYMLIYAPHVIKTPRSRVFLPVHGQIIRQCRILPFDKTVYIHTDNFTIQCYFFGKAPNIFLIDTGENTIDQFKKEGTRPERKRTNEYLDILILKKIMFYERIRESNNQLLQSVMLEILGGFNHLLVNEVLYRCNLKPEIETGDLTGEQRELLFNTIQKIANEINGDSAIIYYKSSRPEHLSLIELTQLSGDYKRESYTDINQAWKTFCRKFIIDHQRLHLQKQIGHFLTGRISYLKKTLGKMLDEENLVRKKEEAELKGNLLLTFAGKVQPGSTTITLENIFSNKNEMISIKLNPAKSVQQNAQNYFKKYKNLSVKREQLHIKKDTFTKELAYWEQRYEKFALQQDLASLSKLHKDLVVKGLLQTEQTKGKADKDLSHSFLHFVLEDKWDIFVGKNAANNNQLTFKFARKHDLWFHAQGVPGSHVIIRLEKNGSIPPQKVIERAASIAAYHSDAMHSAKVPVVYTEARYVRKPHKAAPGLVTLSHEKSIMVKPQKPF